MAHFLVMGWRLRTPKIGTFSTPNVRILALMGFGPVGFRPAAASARRGVGANSVFQDFSCLRVPTALNRSNLRGSCLRKWSVCRPLCCRSGREGNDKRADHPARTQRRAVPERNTGFWSAVRAFRCPLHWLTIPCSPSAGNVRGRREIFPT